MLRNTQELKIEKTNTIKALKVHGPIDLHRYFQEVTKASIERYNEKSFFSNFFTAKKPIDEQAILYSNGPRQRSLIIKSNGNFYFYDLIKGAAASNDVKDVFGDKLVDVSGMESRQNLEKTNYDVGKARELSAEHLRDFETAVQYAYKQIKATQKSAQLKPVSPRMSGGSIGG